jgi:hypothetical protein
MPDRKLERAAAILERLRSSDSGSADVFEAFGDLDALPADVVHEALGAWLGPQPDLGRMDNATRLVQGLPLRPLRLRTIAITTDADVLDLGPVAEEQLRIAGKTWDGVDLAPEERLDGELQGSFAGTLVRRVLADEDAPTIALFDVLTFAEDSGLVFEAGTTRQLALITYGKVEMRDARTRSAIEDALAAVDLPDAEPKVEAKTKAKTKTVARKTPKPEAKRRAKSAASPKPRPKAKTEPKAKPKPKSKSTR